MIPSSKYDSILVVSFGGPEGPDDVLPFLENVLRGRNVPRERMLEVAEHYLHFGGVSPINAQNRELIGALEQELKEFGPDLPVYFGNRNWHPLLPDTLRQMQADGRMRAIAFFTSAFSSYSGCRQYRENIIAAEQIVGPGSPSVDKLRAFYNHPGFIEPMIERVREAIANVQSNRRDDLQLVFTAHSIPLSMAQGCRYEAQFRESSRLVAEAIGTKNWQVAYQSRSGPPSQPWLEPDVGRVIEDLSRKGIRDVVVVPIGFISDHMEVLFDLDTEAMDLSRKLGINMIRAKTVGTGPRFIRMIRELIVERIDPSLPKLSLGAFGPSHDVCPVDCCPDGRPTANPMMRK